jgi:hypothetical protein
MVSFNVGGLGAASGQKSLIGKLPSQPLALSIARSLSSHLMLHDAVSTLHVENYKPRWNLSVIAKWLHKH